MQIQAKTKHSFGCMQMKVEHPSVDDGGFHDGNSASLSNQVMNMTQ